MNPGGSSLNGCSENSEVNTIDSLLEQKVLRGMNPPVGPNVSFLKLKNYSNSTAIEQSNSREHQRCPLFSGPGSTTQDGKEAHLTADQQSSTVAGALGGLNSSIQSNFGKRTYCEDTSGSGRTKAVQLSVVTNSKRSRAAAPLVQTPICQVEECNTDLTSAKEYHRRHKVCGQHSKAAKVIVASQEQRFCQQCSRFHVLSEFDEVKRSCRKRLAGHNERRRKPQPDALLLNTILSPSYFQDDMRLGHFLKESAPFLHHSRISSIPNLWGDSDQLQFLHGKRTWPKLGKMDDGPAYGYPLQNPDMKNKVSGFSQLTNDRFPLLLLENPKGMLPMSHEIAGPKVNQYLKCFTGPLAPDLSLSPSTGLIGQNSCAPPSSGAGLLSGLEATPVTDTVSRDSGRALSLLLPQPWFSHTPVVVSLDSSTQSNMKLDQLVSENQTPIVQASPQTGQQHNFDLTSENLLLNASQSQNISASFGLPVGVLDSLEKEHVRSFIHGLNGVGNFNHRSKFSVMYGHGLRSSQENTLQDLRPNTDLELSPLSESQRACLQTSSESFKFGSSHAGELQYLNTYGSSIFNSQEMM